MTTWVKQGVFGDLQPGAAEARRCVEKLYASKGKDLYITSIREGTHSAGTLHTDGRAFDIRPNGVPFEEVRSVLPKGCEVVDEVNHFHIEYDPK